MEASAEDLNQKPNQDPNLNQEKAREVLDILKSANTESREQESQYEDKVKVQALVESKMERQIGVNKFPCIVCKKKFINKADMKDHVRAVHFAPVIICEECGARMHQKRQEEHMARHHLPALASSGVKYV